MSNINARSPEPPSDGLVERYMAGQFPDTQPASKQTTEMLI
jgi:hypothetical protein